MNYARFNAILQQYGDGDEGADGDDGGDDDDDPDEV